MERCGESANESVSLSSLSVIAHAAMRNVPDPTALFVDEGRERRSNERREAQKRIKIRFDFSSKPYALLGSKDAAFDIR